MFYLDYARRHPETVESAVLEGVAPPHFYIIPLPMARGATAMDRLERACGHDPACSAHFPHFADHFVAVVRRFDADAARLAVRNPATHRMQTVRLTKEVFAETVRHELYFPSGAAYMPVTVERVRTTDYAPLAVMVGQMALYFANVQANGLNLSVSCSEDIPFITEGDVAGNSAGTFEGDVRVRAQQRACKIWNPAPAPASFQEPVRSGGERILDDLRQRRFYTNIWDGVDARFNGHDSQLKTEYSVAPGVPLSRIRLRFDGRAVIEGDGALVIESASGRYREEKPVLYQDLEGGRKVVGGSYRRNADGTIGFRAQSYDESRTLIVDPVILFSGYFGGASQTVITSMAVNSYYNVIVAGYTMSTNLPASGGFKTSYSGGVDALVAGIQAFRRKFALLHLSGRIGR